jgi:hypothetical protein
MTIQRDSTVPRDSPTEQLVQPFVMWPAGLHRPAGRISAEAQSQLVALFWCVRTEQRPSCAGDAGEAWQRQQTQSHR